MSEVRDRAFNQALRCCGNHAVHTRTAPSYSHGAHFSNQLHNQRASTPGALDPIADNRCSSEPPSPRIR